MQNNIKGQLANSCRETKKLTFQNTDIYFYSIFPRIIAVSASIVTQQFFTYEPTSFPNISNSFRTGHMSGVLPKKRSYCILQTCHHTQPNT